MTVLRVARLLRTVRTALATVVLTSPLVLTPAVATATRSAPTQTAPATSRLEVVDQSQWVAVDGAFLLGVDVRGAPAGARLLSSLHPPVADRPAFLRSLFGADLGQALASPPAVALDDVDVAGGVRRVPIVIALRQRGPSAPGRISLVLGLGRAGVYPVQVRLVDANGEQLATFVTHLVRLPVPGTQVIPVSAALLLGIHAPPTISPVGAVDLSPEAVTDIAARVRAVASAPGVPVTLAPTPETIEAMAREPGRPAQLLAELRGAVGRLQVLDGPYVDLALTSWIEAGMDDELARQRERGNAILTEQLAPPDGSTWLASRELSTQAATKLWNLGVRRLVLPGGSFRSQTDRNDVTRAQPFQVKTPLASPLQAVAIDNGLAGRFTLGDDPQLSAHQLLAELAVIHGEAPEVRRGVVITPPAGWQASRALLTTLLRGLADSPILTPVTVDGLFASVPAARDGTDSSGAPEVAELTPRASAPIGDYARDLVALRTRLNNFSSLVGDSPEVDAWLQRLLISGTAELTPSERDRYGDLIRRTIDRRVSAIEAPRRQTVTLTAQEGSIPLTLRSGLSQPVTVVLELETSRRLDFPDGNRVTVGLDPGTEQISIRVRTRSPGDSPLDIRVVSPDGGLVIASTRLTVRSTAVSGIGTVLTVGAAAFLVLWWIRHWRRARRAKRAGPPDGPPDGAPVPSSTSAPTTAAAPT